MSERREYEMTEQQLGRLREASKPVPYIVANGVGPELPYDVAMRFWRELGEELGFEPMTARPSPRGDRFFTAVPKGGAA